MDSILFKKNGGPVNRKSYQEAHKNILSADRRIIDGFGLIGSFYQRLDAADTLTYIDLPYAVSYWWVAKRLLKGLLIKPEGWSDASSIFKGILESYKVLKRCPWFWNEDFLQKLEHKSTNKSLFVIQSISEVDSFIDTQVELSA